MFAFNHFNFNVTDLERSIAFYHDALGLEPVRRKEAADGSFIVLTGNQIGCLLMHYVLSGRKAAASSSRFWGTGKRSFSWS